MSDIDEDLDKKVMVVEKPTPEHPANNMEGDHRRWTTMREVLAELDLSKQHSFCKICGHDIDIHEATKDFKTKFAGVCLHSKSQGMVCPCTQYIPGEVVTEKELNKSDSSQS